MIIVKLHGGLGNQMFQYALGRQVAEKNKAELILDLSWFKKNRWKRYLKNILKITFGLWRSGGIRGAGQEIARDQRPYALACFILDKNIKKIGGEIKAAARPTSFREISEKKYYVFDPEILQAGDQIILNGCWNSAKYFSGIQEKIRQEFSLRPELLNKIPVDSLNKIANNVSVALHIRRGDYFTGDDANKHHGLCDLEYYQKAIALIKSRVTNPFFFIFSDDIDWCRQNLRLEASAVFISGLKNYEDLYLMSRCRHNIIANSTFSWWGAWLNSCPEKIVIAPARWLKDSAGNTRDLLPANWLKI